MLQTSFFTLRSNFWRVSASVREKMMMIITASHIASQHRKKDRGSGWGKEDGGEKNIGTHIRRNMY